MNSDDVSIACLILSDNMNMFSYCDNCPVDNLDRYGYAPYKTKNKIINQFIEKVQKIIPNIYSDDFIKKEKTLLKIGTKNLGLTISIGASVQSNKNALFGALFKRGTLEVSAFLGINNYVCFSFSVGINWTKAYLKTGILLALSKGASGLYVGVYIELSVPTWLLAVSTAAIAIVSIYAPAIGAYVAKTIATIRSSMRVAAPILVPLLPRLVLI